LVEILKTISLLGCCCERGRFFIFFQIVFDTISFSSRDERRWNSLATVIIRSGESQDQLLKRFRKKVAKSGILSTVRRKRWFVSKSELRRIQKKKAIRRIKRRQQRFKGE
jgi:small subunit ribosomal protein S21